MIAMVPTHGEVSADRYIVVALGVLVFAFFGLGRDAVASYRSCLLKMGAGRIFPRLKNENRSPSNTASSSFGSRAKLFVRSKLGSKSASTTE